MCQGQYLPRVSLCIRILSSTQSLKASHIKGITFFILRLLSWSGTRTTPEMCNTDRILILCVLYFEE